MSPCSDQLHRLQGGYANGWLRWALPALAATIGLVSCDSSKKTSSGSGDPVALRVGGQEVLLSELQAEVGFLRDRRSTAVSSREAFIETSIERRVAFQQACRMGLDKDPELRRQWENLLIGRLRQKELDDKLAAVRVTEQEIRAQYEANAGQYSQPAQIHLALLFQKLPAHAGAEVRGMLRARMEAARSRSLSLGPDVRGFGPDAMNDSEEPTSRFKGGDVGWLRAGEPSYPWPQDVMEVAFKLGPVGAVSEVVESGDGFYLLKKLDFREASTRPLDDWMRASLEAAILKQKRESLESQLMHDWKKAVPVEIHEDVIARLEILPPTDTAKEVIPSSPAP